jgi:DNA polymerase (family X)
MPVHNIEIANIFYKYADLLEIEGQNPFRVRAYRNAARVITNTSQSIASMIEEGKNLMDLPGIGKDLTEKIKVIVATGQLPQLEEISEHTPELLSTFMEIPGLGPKRIKILFDMLNISTLDDLKEALAKGKVRQLHGFGEKTEKIIHEGILILGKKANRIKLCDAQEYAEHLVAYLKKAKGILQIKVAGSYRRRVETVGDLDVLVTAVDPPKIIHHFTRYDAITEILSEGTTRSAAKLRFGLHVDLRVVPRECYGAALYYFTGSKSHNIAVRKIAKNKKLKINEYGTFRGKRRIAGETEQQIFDCVGLSFIPPELREDRGEIEAAKKGTLPKLISLKDIRGDLHSHTKRTDGTNTIEEMVFAAEELGYEYLAITEHSKRVTMAKGLDEKALAKHIKEVEKLNIRLKKMTVLKSIEMDILEDGSLDLPNSILKELDLTICSVHYNLKLSRKKQTERILRAMDNPYFNILAHPTGRLINKREPYEINLERIMIAAKERGVFLELNAHPDRLDLNDIGCKLAKELGLKLAISTDSHSVQNLKFMQFGIDQARRGWLEPRDVINTYSLPKLRKMLVRT